MGQRIQKILAHIGVGSRREIERWIIAGKITKNGQKVLLGDRVDTGDSLMIEGKKQNWEKPIIHQTILYNKRVGEVVSRKKYSHPIVFDFLPHLDNGKWLSVGRLDINTSGLLLFSTDGELVNRLMHPSYRLKRIYLVRALGKVEPSMFSRVLSGVDIDGVKTFFDEIRLVRKEKQGYNQWFEVSLSQGRNRIVRRLLATQGLTVNRLIRIGYGPIRLGRDLKAGQWKRINIEQ